MDKNKKHVVIKYLHIKELTLLSSYLIWRKFWEMMPLQKLQSSDGRLNYSSKAGDEDRIPFWTLCWEVIGLGSWQKFYGALFIVRWAVQTWLCFAITSDRFVRHSLLRNTTCYAVPVIPAIEYKLSVV